MNGRRYRKNHRVNVLVATALKHLVDNIVNSTSGLYELPEVLRLDLSNLHCDNRWTSSAALRRRLLGLDRDGVKDCVRLLAFNGDRDHRVSRHAMPKDGSRTLWPGLDEMRARACASETLVSFFAQ